MGMRCRCFAAARPGSRAHLNSGIQHLGWKLGPLQRWARQGLDVCAPSCQQQAQIERSHNRPPLAIAPPPPPPLTSGSASHAPGWPAPGSRAPSQKAAASWARAPAAKAQQLQAASASAQSGAPHVRAMGYAGALQCEHDGIAKGPRTSSHGTSTWPTAASQPPRDHRRVLPSRVGPAPVSGRRRRRRAGGSIGHGAGRAALEALSTTQQAALRTPAADVPGRRLHVLLRPGGAQEGAQSRVGAPECGDRSEAIALSREQARGATASPRVVAGTGGAARHHHILTPADHIACCMRWCGLC